MPRVLNGNEHGNYYRILVLYWDHGQEIGIYYSILSNIGIMEKKMETTIVIT